MGSLGDYLILGAVIAYFLLRILSKSMECPVCRSSSHWVTRYWGSNRDYDQEYCNKCKRALYDLNTGEFTTYDSPQDWI